jgi:hypothetical protein
MMLPENVPLLPDDQVETHWVKSSLPGFLCDPAVTINGWGTSKGHSGWIENLKVLDIKFKDSMTVDGKKDKVSGVIVWAKLPKQRKEQMGFRMIVNGDNTGSIGQVNHLDKAEKNEVEFQIRIKARDPGTDKKDEVFEYLKQVSIKAPAAIYGTKLIVGGDSKIPVKLNNSSTDYFIFDIVVDAPADDVIPLHFDFGDDVKTTLDWGGK